MFGELGLELGVDLWGLVFELVLVAALLDALVDVLLAAGLWLVGAPADGEKIGRFGAGVEVRVPPALRRHKHAARAPIDPLDLLPRGAHHAVALSTQQYHVNARAMAVELGVTADRPCLAVRAHRGVHHRKGLRYRATASATRGDRARRRRGL